MTTSRTSVIHGSFPGGGAVPHGSAPFPQGSCNGHVLLVAFLLANSKALSLSQPPTSEMSAVDPSFNRRPENALEHFLLAASALTVASVRFVSRCIVSSSSTAMTSNFLKRIMAHPMIPGGTLSTVQSVLGSRASCLSSFPLELQTVVVWNPDVQLTIEAAEAPKRRVDGVESVGGSDDDRLPTTLHAIHERKKLGDYARLITLGSNGVNLINEDDGGSVFLDLLEGLAKIGLRLRKNQSQCIDNFSPVQEQHIMMNDTKIEE